MISTGAKVLGSFTVGDNVRIGAGSVVLKAVPPDCTVVGVPGKIVNMNGHKLTSLQATREVNLHHDQLPDPVADVLVCMHKNMERLEKRIRELEDQNLQLAGPDREELTGCRERCFLKDGDL
jgi:serine O-acetyltransferase